MRAIPAKGSTETAWLASLLLESADNLDAARAAEVASMVAGLGTTSHSFDAGTQERLDLLAALARDLVDPALAGRKPPPAHAALLSHLARGLLLGPVRC
jgi:hypothetical protein